MLNEWYSSQTHYKIESPKFGREVFKMRLRMQAIDYMFILF